MVRALKTHRRRQKAERLKAGARWIECDVVFCNSIGKPLDPRNATRHFHQSLKAAGLAIMGFHKLRHSCASLLLAKNIHPRVVMDVLGHSDIRLTLETYSHVIPALRSEAADAIDAALDETEENQA